MSSESSLCDISAGSIVAAVRQTGACAAGVCEAEAVGAEARRLLDDWLARGCHGTMDYLERNRELSADPSALLPGCRSIICAAYAYGGHGRSELFADYALGRDYHKELKSRLKPVARELERLVTGSRTRICTDSAPLRERYWAERAGLGRTAHNGLLAVPGFGTKVLLGEILWTHLPEGSSTAPGIPAEGVCTQCGACVRACPQGALDGKGGLDARKCLSYLTIEYRGELPRELRLPGRIFGCDICQDACPLNRGLSAGTLGGGTKGDVLRALRAEDLVGMTEEEYDILTEGTALRRAALSQLLRNLSKRGCAGEAGKEQIQDR